MEHITEIAHYWPCVRFLIHPMSEETKDMYAHLSVLPCANLTEEDLGNPNIKVNTDLNSGVDIMLPRDVTFPPGVVVDVGLDVRARCLSLSYDASGKCYGHFSPYTLRSRSSISKPAEGKNPQRALTLLNGVGTIDVKYERELVARIINLDDKPITVPKGTSLVQLCSPSLHPVEYRMLSETSSSFSAVFAADVKSTRGGLGSTGKSGGSAKKSDSS